MMSNDSPPSPTPSPMAVPLLTPPLSLSLAVTDSDDDGVDGGSVILGVVVAVAEAEVVVEEEAVVDDELAVDCKEVVEEEAEEAEEAEEDELETDFGLSSTAKMLNPFEKPLKVVAVVVTLKVGLSSVLSQANWWVPACVTLTSTSLTDGIHVIWFSYTF